MNGIAEPVDVTDMCRAVASLPIPDYDEGEILVRVRRSQVRRLDVLRARRSPVRAAVAAAAVLVVGGLFVEGARPAVTAPPSALRDASAFGMPDAEPRDPALMSPAYYLPLSGNAMIVQFLPYRDWLAAPVCEAARRPAARRPCGAGAPAIELLHGRLRSPAARPRPATGRRSEQQEHDR